MSITTTITYDEARARFTAWADATKADDRSALAGLTPSTARVQRRRGKREAKPATKAAVTVPPVYYSRPNGVDYYPRTLGGHEDVTLCRQARAEGMPVLLYGAPGTGKTALLEAAYHSESGGIFTVSGSADTERSDFVGTYVQAPDGKFPWVDGPLIKAMETGGVLFVDEIALVDPMVLSTVYALMDGRNELVVTENPGRGIVRAAPGFFVVGACNPNVPGARMSEALTSRFLVQAEYDTDYALAQKLGVESKFITAARNLEVKRQSGEVSWAPQMRECLAYQKVADTFGYATALANLVAVAPEIDRDQVASVLSSTYGTPVKALRSV
jgi:MoxR-like ATPase